MKGWAHTMSSLSMFSQLGLSLAAPLLLCVLICSWLTGRFGIGTWIYIPGFSLGWEALELRPGRSTRTL